MSEAIHEVTGEHYSARFVANRSGWVSIEVQPPFQPTDVFLGEVYSPRKTGKALTHVMTTGASTILRTFFATPLETSEGLVVGEARPVVEDLVGTLDLLESGEYLNQFLDAEE